MYGLHIIISPDMLKKRNRCPSPSPKLTPRTAVATWVPARLLNPAEHLMLLQVVPSLATPSG